MITNMRNRLLNGETVHVARPERPLYDVVPLQGDLGYATYTVHVDGVPATQPAPIDDHVDQWESDLNEILSH